MRESKLYKQIINPENIYNAIYSIESYIFEQYLLSADDIQDFNRLKDKFDDKFISAYVDKCIKQIRTVIDSEELFDCDVYFKAKKYDESEDKVEFRPIHTASLLDQICMVVMLSSLMFDDDSGKRKLSAISRLLPANFYGNIPSKNVSELFKPWKKQYKDYSNDALAANRNHFESKKFKYELTLDLKRFFPSINPVFVFNYVWEKWPVNAFENDKECLSKILEKLLFFKLNLPIELKAFYYPNDLKNIKNLGFNMGIAQGLPQAYFFGNICMTIIAKHENKLLKGDSYFYVDDSIIYTNEEVKSDTIETLVNDFNTEVNKYLSLNRINNSEIIRFHKQVEKEYELEIHPLGKKSEFRNIDKVESLFLLAKPASLFPFEIRTAQDEFEDTSLLKKAQALLKTVDYLLTRAIEKAELQNPDKIENQIELTRLYRFRKFYLNRINYLRLSQSIDLLYDEEKIDKFINDFQLKKHPKESDFFKKFDSDVFCFESILIAEQVANISDLKDKFLSSVLAFELSCLDKKNKTDIANFLYFNKVLTTVSDLSTFPNNRYDSLKYGKITQGINNKNRSTNELKIDRIQEILSLVK